MKEKQRKRIEQAQRRVRQLTEQIRTQRGTVQLETLRQTEFQLRRAEDELRRARAGAPPCSSYDPHLPITVAPNGRYPRPSRIRRLPS